MAAVNAPRGEGVVVFSFLSLPMHSPAQITSGFRSDALWRSRAREVLGSPPVPRVVAIQKMVAPRDVAVQRER